MKTYLFIAAVTGFVTSVIVHLLTFTDISVMKVFPGVFVLHIGIFGIMLVSAFALKNQTSNLNNLPRKLTVTLMCLFAYAGFNFFASMHLNEMGVPGTVAGKPVLEAHGRVIRFLTATESAHHENYLVRGFSGHWMLFYFLIAAGLRPKKSGSE
jgi:hypothetical protein